MAYQKSEGLPILQMKTAVMVWRSGSMLRTGKALGIQRSSVWSRIKTLEDIVGFPIFRQSEAERILEPTERGLELLRFCQPFVDDYERMLERFIEAPRKRNAARALVAAVPGPYCPAAVIDSDNAKRRAGRLLEVDTVSVIESVHTGLAQVGVVECDSTCNSFVQGLCASLDVEAQVLHRTGMRALMARDGDLKSMRFRAKVSVSLLAPQLQVCYHEPGLPGFLRGGNFAARKDRVMETTTHTSAIRAVKRYDGYQLGTGYCERRWYAELVAVPTLPEREVLVVALHRRGADLSGSARPVLARIRSELAGMKRARDDAYAAWTAARETGGA